MAQSRKHKKKQTVIRSRVPTRYTPRAPSAAFVSLKPAPESFGFNRWEWLLVAGILIITFLGFVNALNGQFVYDDRLQILRNPTIQRLANVPRMFTQSVWQFEDPTSDQPVGSYYRPLFNIALIINYHVFGQKVLGWHLVCLLLHLTVTLLVYWLVRQWGLRPDVAAAAAFLFGLHPVHSESVAWISALPDPLAAVFIFSSLVLYERYYHGLGGRGYLLALSWVFTLLAMLSKEVAIVFPLIFIFREWLDRSGEETLGATVFRLVARTTPYLIIAVFYIGLRYYVMGFISKVDSLAMAIPTGQVFLTLPWILLSYTRMLFIPFPLAIMYGHTYVQSAADPRFWGSALVVAVLIAWTIWRVRASIGGRWAFLWLILFLLPVLNLKAFNQEESLVHDRYLYLPSLGFCLLIALALARISGRFRARQRPIFVTATVLIGMLFFGLTVYQNRSWQNDLTMVNYALRVAPEWPFLHDYIGTYYGQQGKLAEAEQAYLQAIKFKPTFHSAYSKLGSLYQLQGKFDQAEQAYLKALEYGSPYPATYLHLGLICMDQGKLAEAERYLLVTINLQPSEAVAYHYLGRIYGTQGRNALAEQAYRKAIEQNRSYVQPYIGLAAILAKQQRYKEALEHLQTAQRHVPNDTQVLYALGEVHLRANHPEEAADMFNALLRRYPEHRLAHTGLGLCYEAMGNKEQAKIHFQKALEVAPREPWTNVAREHLATLKE